MLFTNLLCLYGVVDIVLHMCTNVQGSLVLTSGSYR